MRKILLTTAFTLCTSIFATAQSSHCCTYSNNDRPVCGLDAAITAGTDGIGVELAMPIKNILQIRAGFTYMPRISHKMRFGIKVGDNDETEQEQQEKFDELSDMLEQMTGSKVDRNIDMVGKPTMQNFKFLVDVFPFRDKHWHVTAGFYWGPSRIAKAVNALEDATSLVAVSMYNSLHDRIINSYENDEPYMHMNGSDIYATEDMYNQFMEYGHMGVHVGDYKGTGKHYVMVPDKNNTVSASIIVNNFKPYVGFGYGGRLFKDDDRYQVSFDCGVMFWGGTPTVVTHDGTDLAKEVKNISGKVGDYVDFAKKIKAWPVLNIRISRRIF